MAQRVNFGGDEVDTYKEEIKQPAQGVLLQGSTAIVKWLVVQEEDGYLFCASVTWSHGEASS